MRYLAIAMLVLAVLWLVYENSVLTAERDATEIQVKDLTKKLVAEHLRNQRCKPEFKL